jgi:hypothetical protein
MALCPVRWSPSRSSPYTAAPISGGASGAWVLPKEQRGALPNTQRLLMDRQSRSDPMAETGEPRPRHRALADNAVHCGGMAMCANSACQKRKPVQR